MKIYTKTGDTGQTSLFGGARLYKNNIKIESYGCVDELNASLGIAVSELNLIAQNDSSSQSKSLKLTSELTQIQNDLFTLGAELATPSDQKLFIQALQEDSIIALETQIDQMDLVLAKLQNFILPGGSKTASSLHLSRTIARRAERICVELSLTEQLRPEVIQYLNRLSDYLFTAARYANHIEGKSEIIWKAAKVT